MRPDIKMSTKNLKGETLAKTSNYVKANFYKLHFIYPKTFLVKVKKHSHVRISHPKEMKTFKK